jgi:hypothetical protein
MAIVAGQKRTLIATILTVIKGAPRKLLNFLSGAKRCKLRSSLSGCSLQIISNEALKK